jgi:hypothetical protein
VKDPNGQISPSGAPQPFIVQLDVDGDEGATDNHIDLFAEIRPASGITYAGDRLARGAEGDRAALMSEEADVLG